MDVREELILFSTCIFRRPCCISLSSPCPSSLSQAPTIAIFFYASLNTIRNGVEPKIVEQQGQEHTELYLNLKISHHWFMSKQKK
jgi:hypothetical protein